ncbi:hypothetical protein FB45DRAFT_1130661, partial [Roridomyces roridus]
PNDHVRRLDGPQDRHSDPNINRWIKPRRIGSALYPSHRRQMRLCTGLRTMGTDMRRTTLSSKLGLSNKVGLQLRESTLFHPTSLKAALRQGFQAAPLSPPMTPSVPELLQSLARQKEALRILERQLGATRSQLNSALDPMMRLPVEISSEIFVHCLSEAHTWDALWTLIGLWKDISDTGVPLGSFSQFFEIWVSRWSNRMPPFSLSIRAENVESFWVMDVPHRRSLFDALTSFTIHDVDGSSVSFETCCRILGAAPNLLQFTNIRSAFSERTSTALTHSQLRALHLGKAYPDPLSSRDHFLQQMTLPALQTLRVPEGSLAIQNVARFLEQSSYPPLLLLHISLGPASPDELVAFFQHLPGLIDLDISLPLDALRFLELLTLHPDLLPALQNLVVYEADPDPTRPHRVLEFVTTRQTTLKSLRVIVRRAPAVTPVDDRFALPLREFMRRGIDISIEYGEGRNLGL